MESSVGDVSGSRVAFEYSVLQRMRGCKICQSFALIAVYKSLSDDQMDTLMQYLEQHKLSAHKRKGNGAPSGAFAFTITKSPKDPFSVGDMLTAVRKVLSQKSCPVIKYAWYYEEKGRDENGDPIHPHIHGMYETESGGRIEAKHFGRAWSIWDESKPQGKGFRGGYHRPVKSDEAYADYIKKDGGMSESKGLTDSE